MLRVGTRSSAGVARLMLNSRLIEGRASWRADIGMPLAAMRRAASLKVQRNGKVVM